MITRLVKMTFQKSNTQSFESVFKAHQAKIKSQKGCLHLELWNHTADARVYFTYSIWQSEADLEAYRNSALFKSVWSLTKLLFEAAPEAWTLNKVD
mgnify:FL=1